MRWALLLDKEWQLQSWVLTAGGLTDEHQETGIEIPRRTQVTDIRQTEGDNGRAGTQLGSSFLVNELDAVETKLRRRMNAVDSEAISPQSNGRDRQMANYHSLQTKVIWWLMQAKSGELHSILQRHGTGQRISDSRPMVREGRREKSRHTEEEHEILAELSRRWNIWLEQYGSPSAQNVP